MSNIEDIQAFTEVFNAVTQQGKRISSGVLSQKILDGIVAGEFLNNRYITTGGLTAEFNTKDSHLMFSEGSIEQLRQLQQKLPKNGL